MAADFSIKQGDTLPILNDTLTYSDGSAANLTGASVKFVMRSFNNAAVTTSAAAAIVSPTAGTVSYTFTSSDSAVSGQYMGCWIVTFSGGAQQTWPTDGYLDIWVEDNLTSDTNQYLVSLPDAKDHLNIPGSDRTQDQKLTRWIKAARPVIEIVTGPIVQQSYDEWYDGGQYFIHLRHRPAFLLEFASIYLGPVEYPMAIEPNPQLGTIYSVMLSPTGDRLVRRGPGGGVIGFPNMPDSVHVGYKAGQPSIPENVRLACLELIRENWVPTQKPGWGRENTSVDDEVAHSVTPEFLMSPRVREMLVPNRRHPSVF